MNHIKTITSKLFGRVGKTSVLLVAGIAILAFAMPTSKEAASAIACNNPPTQPQLNVYPITFSDPAELCHDYSPIDARLTTGQYSQSQADYNDGLTAQDGNEVYVLAYIHNGAANVGVPDSQTLAHNVSITFTVPTSDGTDHVVSTTFGGSDTNTVNGSFTIHTPDGSHLEVVPASGQLFDDTGTQVLQSGFDVANGHSFNIGDMHACFEHSVFVRFKVKVVKNIQQSNNAVCIGSVVITPNPATPGQAFTGTVSVQNTGTTTWTNPGYFLAAQNTTFSPSQLQLPNTIPPNGQVSFQLSGTLPNAPGSYNGAWQMSQNGTTFGAICPVTVVVQNINPTPTTLRIVKEVRDVTTSGNSGFSHSTNANNGDTVEYRIKITNIGQFTAKNVVATDTMAAALSYIQGSLSVSGNFSGQLTNGGMSLGDLNPNQTVTIIYRATVNQSSGTITNTATARADNASLVQDQANVIINIINNQPICAQANQTVNVNQTVFFTASGGNGSFFWQAPGGNPSTGNSSSFNTVYNSQGSYTVTVTSNGLSASCNVFVNPINNQFRQLSITKLVRNITSGNSGFQNSVNANNNDRVEYQITVTNTGSSDITNVHVDDSLPNGITLLNSFDGNFGTMTVGQSRTLTFQATVNSTGLTAGSCLQNTAGAQGDSTSRVTASATVCVSSVAGTNVNLQFSKKASNDTQNVMDATSVTANRQDFITYTLTATNTGNGDATNFIITDDLSGVLPFADMVDLNGGTLNGNVISYPAVTVPAGGSVSKTFRVRVKFNLQNSLTFVMRNTYGNTVTINIGGVQGVATFVAPTTGTAGTSAAVFAGLVTLGFIAFRKRQWLYKLVFA